MRRAIKLLALLAVSSIVSIAAWVCWYALSAPGVENLPLSDDLIAVSSSEGQLLLADSPYKADYAQLVPVLEPQLRRGFCGPATGAAVINATLSPSSPATQFSIFDTAAAVKSELAVTFSGLTLAELAVLLRANGLRVRSFYAEQSDVGTFRNAAQLALSDSSTFVVVNYDRRVLDQEGAGHISPLGAYNPATDRLLVMDVAAYKYPYTWVPTSKLWHAMSTVDADSGRTRGFLLVTGNVPARSVDGQ